MLRKILGSALLFLSILGGPGCGSGSDETDSPPSSRTVVVFDTGDDSVTDLFAFPFPNDLRIKEDGTIDLAGLSTHENPAIQKYIDMIVENPYGGFSTQGGAFFRFTAPLDPSCLPASFASSVEPSSSVQWIDVDPDSPELGRHIPVLTKFSEEGGKYIGDNHLAVLPVPGFPLRPNTTYAVVLTNALCDAQHAAPSVNPVISQLLSDASPPANLERAYEIYAPLREHRRVEALDGIVAATVFTTGDPTRQLMSARDVVMGSAAPVASDVKLVSDSGNFYELAGAYDTPLLQSGTPPFDEEGGAFELDAAGNPKILGVERMPFTLTLPKDAPMPAEGWPVVIYAHGTGGTRTSCVRGGFATQLSEVLDDGGEAISRMAVIGINEPLHGERAAGGDPSLTYFNMFNPRALVHNALQSGLDDLSLLRMMKGLSLSNVPSVQAGQPELVFDPPVKFDTSRMAYFGHSQGAVTAPLFLALAPEIKGVVLSSGGGGAMLDLMKRTEPIIAKGMLELFVGDPLDEFHPVSSMLQHVLEPTDGIDYAAMMMQSRPGGAAPLHIFATEGMGDPYVVNESTEALATALGIPQAEPVLERMQTQDLLGLEATALPAKGNLTLSGVPVTAAVSQFMPHVTSDACTRNSECLNGYCEANVCVMNPHFSVSFVPEAIVGYRRFLATMMRDGIPSIEN